MINPYKLLIFVCEKSEVGNNYMNLKINNLQSPKRQNFFSHYVSENILPETIRLN